MHREEEKEIGGCSCAGKLQQGKMVTLGHAAQGQERVCRAEAGEGVSGVGGQRVCSRAGTPRVPVLAEVCGAAHPAAHARPRGRGARREGEVSSMVQAVLLQGAAAGSVAWGCRTGGAGQQLGTDPSCLGKGRCELPADRSCGRRWERRCHGGPGTEG